MYDIDLSLTEFDMSLNKLSHFVLITGRVQVQQQVAHVERIQGLYLLRPACTGMIERALFVRTAPVSKACRTYPCGVLDFYTYMLR